VVKPLTANRLSESFLNANTNVGEDQVTRSVGGDSSNISMFGCGGLGCQGDPSNHRGCGEETPSPSFVAFGGRWKPAQSQLLAKVGRESRQETKRYKTGECLNPTRVQRDVGMGTRVIRVG